MTFCIRKAIHTDSELLYEMVCDLENTQFPKKAFESLFNSNLKDSRIGYFIAQIDDRVIGFGSIHIHPLLHHCGKIAEIQELFVSNTHRNKNIGQALLKRMIEWSKEQQSLQIEVTCNNSRTGAHRFYKANNFVHTHQKLVLKHTNMQ